MSLGLFFFIIVGYHSNLHPKVHHFRSSSNPSITKELDEQWNYIVKNKICIPVCEIFVGNEDEVVQRIPKTYLGEKLFDHSHSVQFESSPSTTLYNTEEEDDITAFFFEIGEPYCSQASLLDVYPVIDTLNLDKPVIDFNNEIVSDSALNNNIVPNLSDEKVVMVGSHSSVSNDPPLIDKNTLGCSKDSHTSDSYSSSEANALYLVLGGSPELKIYDMEKHLFKLGKASLDAVNSLKYSLAKFQQQVLKKVSTLEVQFGDWERSFLLRAIKDFRRQFTRKMVTSTKT